jgi:hypothetical protein
MRRNPLFRFRRDLISAWLGAALLLVVFAPVTLRAQTGFGTILGRVTDNSGAVVPIAKITLRNEATNVSNVTEANGDGEYVFPNLIPGAYEITVSKQGFKLFTVSHIELLVSQTVREDAELAVGATSTTVNVTASAPLVQTDTSSVESVIDSKQIETMPLNGRQNVFGLLALAPGVQGGAWGMYTPKFGGNTVEGSYNVRIDGVDSSESENEYIGIGDPSLDAIAEFKVIDSMGSAKYGTGAASVIMVTKSGTNQFHGTAFEYNQVDNLTAQNFFATSQPKSQYVRNEFGGTFGGPIKKDKLFFFGSFEGLTARSPNVSESAMPTAALLEGNFSGLPAIIDPSTGQPFQGNQIPQTRFSSVSQDFFKYFDTPNLPSTAPGGLGTNFIASLRTKQDELRYEGRGDYNINSKNQLSAMWFDARYVPRDYAGFSPKFGAFLNPATYQNVGLNLTSTLKPNLTNLATFGFHRVWDQGVYQDAGQFDMHSIFPQMPQPPAGLGGLPNLAIPGFAGLYEGGGGGDNEQTYEGSDTVTWAKGKHLVEAGFSYMHWKFTNYGLDDNGSFTFNGFYTSGGNSNAPNYNAFADYLLGDLSASNYAVLPVTATPVNNRFGFFITDDWKATSKLTLNLGLRYDLPTLYQNSPGNMSNFYPNLDELVTLKGTGVPSLFPGVPIVSGSSVGLNSGNYIGTDHTMFSPRIGLAYRPLGTSRLILRGGYGLYYVSIPWVWGSFQMVRNAPFTAELNYVPTNADPSDPTLTFADPFPTGEGSNSAAVNPSANALPTHYRYPATHQWNFTVESQLTPNSSLRISYLGAESEHVTQQFNLNDPVPAPLPEGLSYNQVRPYQPFGPITLWANEATANSQQLQISARRRFASGLSFEGEFSWTKMLDLGSYPEGPWVTDNRNIRLDRGNDPYVRPLNFVGNYTYELPFGKGRHFLASASRPLDLIVGGWQTSGIMTIASGLPFSLNFDSSLPNWPSNYADKIGNPHVSNPSLNEWFNPAAYAVPANYAFGNAAPNSLFGPRYFDWDMGAFKTFPLTERFKLTFRSDLMNVLNHPNFANPNNDISQPQSVGTITWASGPTRVVQFSLRLAF